VKRGAEYQPLLFFSHRETAIIRTSINRETDDMKLSLEEAQKRGEAYMDAGYH
jgi:hypothetical protein